DQRSRQFLDLENALVAELTRASGSQRQALALIALSRSTWHYRCKPRLSVADPVPQKDRAYRSRISAADRAVIEDKIRAGWQAGHSVDHSFACCWDDGVMLASRRSWWRIAATIVDQSARPVGSKRASNTGPRPAPVLKATGPEQVWSWDITDLRSPWRGVAFKAYSIIDIYSRKIVGWRVEERECDDLAKDMFDAAFAEHGVPQFVSCRLWASDAVDPAQRPPVRSGCEPDPQPATSQQRQPVLRVGVPHHEIPPQLPCTFEDINAARTWVASYVPWYNQQHRHSGIALFTPAQVHSGAWAQSWHQRDRTHQAYYDAH